MTDTPKPIRIYVDADACPVKDHGVAARHRVPVTVVAVVGFIRVPQDPLIERIAAGTGIDAADNWIAERAGAGDIVITADIPLASRLRGRRRRPGDRPGTAGRSPSRTSA